MADLTKLPAATVRQVQEVPKYLVEDGAEPEMHICRVAQRCLRELWMDAFHPGWRNDRFNGSFGTPF